MSNLTLENSGFKVGGEAVFPTRWPTPHKLYMNKTEFQVLLVVSWFSGTAAMNMTSFDM